MRDYLCFYHHDVEAEAMCNHCHKPYCSKCKVETPLGKFCCFECSGQYAAFKSKWRDPKTEFWTLGKVVSIVVCLAGLAVAAAWAGHSVLGIRALEKFDIIGRLRS